MKDILENQNIMPFDVPEGYFDTLAEKIRPWEDQRSTGKVFRKIIPYMSMAAMFALIAAAGTAVLKFSSPQDELQEYADLLYYSPGPVTESIYYSYNYEDERITEDDIIEYLIYNGTGIDEIAYNE